jgi:hypothetical protein
VRIADADALAEAVMAAVGADGQPSATGRAAAAAARRALTPDTAPLDRAVDLILRHLPPAAP